MNEQFIEFIWKYQYFNLRHLKTHDQRDLTIIQHGEVNSDAGPDLLKAKIKIGRVIWVGSVELHVKSSDWLKHKHDLDPNYQNVILHVVWEMDKRIRDQNGNDLPTLELKGRVPRNIIWNYENLRGQLAQRPCSTHLGSISSLSWTQWKSRLIVQRLQRKSEVFEAHLRKSNGDWTKTFWTGLFRAFGMKVNADVFEALILSIPIRLFQSYSDDQHKIEALLYGQAGLLNSKVRGAYPKSLSKEYEFLKLKHGLVQGNLNFKLLRMRPNNFPQIKIAQLAALIYRYPDLLSQVVHASELENLRALFRVKASKYWDTHFHFFKESQQQEKLLGNEFINSIIINAIVPFLFLFGKKLGKSLWVEKALEHLENSKCEDNKVIRNWKGQSVPADSALCSQSLLELDQQYCRKKACLRCDIGRLVINQG